MELRKGQTGYFYALDGCAPGTNPLGQASGGQVFGTVQQLLLRRVSRAMIVALQQIGNMHRSRGPDRKFIAHGRAAVVRDRLYNCIGEAPQG